MPGRPYYDDFYAQDTAWARSRLFEALERVGASPGTNDVLTVEDELVPFLPEDPTGRHDPRPDVVPAVVDQGNPNKPIPDPGVGRRMYVVTNTQVVVIDDETLRLVSEAPKIDPGVPLPRGMLVVPADGRIAMFLTVWQRIEDPNGDTVRVAEFDCSQHPRRPLGPLNPPYTKQVPLFFAAASPDPRDQLVYATTWRSTQLEIRRFDQNQNLWKSNSLSGGYGGMLVVSSWRPDTARDVYVVVHGDTWADQRSRVATRIVRTTVREGANEPQVDSTPTQFVNIQDILSQNETPTALALSSKKLYVAFPHSRLVSAHALTNGNSFTKITFDTGPRGLAVNGDLLCVACQDDPGVVVIEISELDDPEATTILDLVVDGDFRAMACSADGVVLYVAHQTGEGGRVSLFDLSEPRKPFKPRLLRVFPIDDPVQLVLARAPGEATTGS